MPKTPTIRDAIEKLRFLLTRKEKLHCLFIAFFAFFSSLFELSTAALIVIFSQILNRPELGPLYFNKILNPLGLETHLSTKNCLFILTIGLGLFYLIKNGIAMIEVFFQNFTIQKMSCAFKSKLLKKYANTHFIASLDRNAAYGCTILENDVYRIFSFGMVPLATVFSELTVFITLISMIVFLNPHLFLFIGLSSMVVYLTLNRMVLPLFYRWGESLQQSSEQSTRNLIQFLQGFKEIILLGKKDAFVSQYEEFDKEKSRIIALQTATNALPRMILEILFVGFFVLTILFLFSHHTDPIQLMGILGGYLYLGFRLMPGLNRIIMQINHFKGVIPCIERVYAEFSQYGEEHCYENRPDFHFNDSISIENLSFQYPNTKTQTLKNISFKIKKGEWIGIIGETGSGKSTLIDLILGLYQSQKGHIIIDNQFSPSTYQWHQQIGYVPQRVYLIDDTIAKNIAFGDNEEHICKKRLNQAIDEAQLREFINNLPNQEETRVGENGIHLSGGECQRIAIARALYRDPAVLIFDEASSALDTETEKKLFETLYKMKKEKTVIMIAHRLSTLEKTDKIIKIENGHLLEMAASSQYFERKTHDTLYR